jgi:hypothetical protein
MSVSTTSSRWFRVVMRKRAVPPIGLGGRRADLEHLPLYLEHVARQHRAWPTQLIGTESNQAPRGLELALDQEPHRQRHGVPPGRHQPAEDTRLGQRLVQVERLRIERGGKCSDCLEIERNRAARVSLADLEVFQVASPRVRRRLLSCGNDRVG